MFSRAISGVGILVLVILISVFSGKELIAQQLDNIILRNTSWLEKSETKKWEKQLSELEKAEELLKESNDKYLEIGNIESDEDIDDDKKTKVIKSLEDEALKGSLESLEKYRAIYLELTKIIEFKLGDEHLSHPAYKSMNKYLDQADAEYNRADEAEGFDKTEKLTSANEYQLRALESGINIFTTSASVTYNEEAFDSPENVVPDDDIVIDARLLKMYQDYQNNGAIQDPLTAYKLLNLQEDQITYSSFEEMWYKYQNNDFAEQFVEMTSDTMSSDSLPTGQTELMVSVDPNQAELNEGIPQFSNTLTASNTSTTSNTSKSGNEDKTLLTQSESQKSTSKQHSAETETNNSQINRQLSQTTTTEKEAVNDNSSTTVSGRAKSESPVSYTGGSDFEFRVQIAASQSPLSINHIETIYQGGLPVIELKEGKYYKYQIRGFHQLSQAQKVCSETGVGNAYIEAYKSSDRVKLSEAANASRMGNNNYNSGKIEFAVQFAASRVRLSENRVSEIFNLPEGYRTVYENGWYKYQVYTGDNLENAYGILERLNKEKAFIVAYKNGQKLKLYSAIQEYKRNLP